MVRLVTPNKPHARWTQGESLPLPEGQRKEGGVLSSPHRFPLWRQSLRRGKGVGACGHSPPFLRLHPRCPPPSLGGIRSWQLPGLPRPALKPQSTSSHRKPLPRPALPTSHQLQGPPPAGFPPIATHPHPPKTGTTALHTGLGRATARSPVLRRPTPRHSITLGPAGQLAAGEGRLGIKQDAFVQPLSWQRALSSPGTTGTRVSLSGRFTLWEQAARGPALRCPALGPPPPPPLPPRETHKSWAWLKGAHLGSPRHCLGLLPR